LTRDIGFVILRSHTEINTSHMRTKTLLLTAALTAAGVATSMAQVYSVNMVGYINHTIPSGFSMLANQLNNSPDNKVVTQFPTPPEGTQVYKYDAATDTFAFMQFVDSAWEGDEGFADVAVGPGEGIWINSPSSFAHTFVGEVQLASSLSLLSGFNMVSSVLPQALPLTGNPNDGVAAAPVGLGFQIAEGDQVYQFRPADDQFTFSQFADGQWEGDNGDAVPSIGISEAFWINLSSPRSWSRNFVVGID
jgi:hypothetical protein